MSRLVTCFIVGLVPFLGAPAPAQSPEPIQVDIVAQPVGDALNEFAEQSGLQVVLYADDAEGINVATVAGRFDDATLALDSLLAGTGLEYSFINDRTVAVAPVQKVAGERGNSEAGNARTAGAGAVLMTRARTSAQKSRTSRRPETDSDKDEQKRPLEEIVVTGTSIRGVYPSAVPLEVFSAEAIAKTGATTVEGFFTRLPQNLNNLTSIAPNATLGTRDRDQVNLRGLGTGATLILINGHRIVAPGGLSPDVSLIPLSAVERVEVLSDGASAVYGSDAIGGVVNIILRDEAEGAETSVSYGTVTDGSHHQIKADQSFGHNWQSGNFVAGYTFFDKSDLDASERDFSNGALTPFTLIPENRRHSAVFSLNQDVNDHVRLSGDVLYSSRDSNAASNRAAGSGPPFLDESLSEAKQIFTSLSAAIDLTDRLHADVSGVYSEYEQDREIIRDGALLIAISQNASYLDLNGKLQGDLFDLPAGAMKFSIGGGYSEEEYIDIDIESGGVETSIDRNSFALFGEVFVPLVGAENRSPGMERLELNVAARYTEYSDFDGELSPRVGVFWSPIEGVGLRGTYSQGFRAPSLDTLLPDSGSASNAILSPTALGAPDPFSTDGSSIYLFVQGNNNPNLGPESSETFTIGMDIEPAFAPDLRVSGTYFNISYADRLAEPDGTGGLRSIFDPASFPSLFTPNPSPEYVAEVIAGSINFLNTTPVDPTDPTAVASVVTVILDDRVANIAESKIDGFDFSVDYRRGTSLGELNSGANFTYILDSTRLPTLNSPVIETFDTVLHPVAFRGRAFVGLTRDRFSGQMNLNYYDDYKNSFVTPEVGVESWTTVDLNMLYDFGAQDNFSLSGLALSLNVINLFDQDPPFVGLADTTNTALNESVGFDPANANPTGRFIQLGVRKRF